MKAEELRIGNFILDNEAEATKTIYWRVEQISQYRIGDKRIGVLFRGGSCWTVMDCIEPIPLTEEWLKKFGFNGEFKTIKTQNVKDYNRPECNYKVQISFQDINHKDGVFEIWHSILDAKMDYNDELYEVATTPIAYPHIKHVHQLQNLYFALTGTELELKK